MGISKLLRKDLLSIKSDNNDKSLELNSQLLEAKFQSFIKSSKNRLNLSTGILMALSHENVLKRGFAIIKDGNNKLVRSSKSLEKNQRLKVFFSDNDIIDVDIN
jgi:exonuclease VII large subunit